jgi:hypothetical protein
MIDVLFVDIDQFEHYISYFIYLKSGRLRDSFIYIHRVDTTQYRIHKIKNRLLYWKYGR